MAGDQWLSGDLLALIDAARDLAWQPTHNVSGIRLQDRHEAHERVRDLLEEVHFGRSGDPVLDLLVEAIRRAATCSYSNRCGLPYHHRKRSIEELRGCLAVFDREG